MAVRVEPSRKADANRLAALKAQRAAGEERDARISQQAHASTMSQVAGAARRGSPKTPGDGGDVGEHRAGNQKPDAQARPGQSRRVQGGQDQQGQDDLAMSAEERERNRLATTSSARAQPCPAPGERRSRPASARRWSSVVPAVEE